jgi:hypothetical protein
MAKEVVRPPPKGKKKKKKKKRGFGLLGVAGPPLRPVGLGWLGQPILAKGVAHNFFVFNNIFLFLKIIIIIIILMVKTTSFWSPKWCNFGVRDKIDFLAGSVRISQMKS